MIQYPYNNPEHRIQTGIADASLLILGGCSVLLCQRLHLLSRVALMLVPVLLLAVAPFSEVQIGSAVFTYFALSHIHISFLMRTHQ